MGLKFNWKIPNYSDIELKTLKQNYNLTDVQAKLFLSRKIINDKNIREYLIGEYDEGFDPFLMSDMQIAVDRINLAIEKEEKILVYGDYDSDGITATVLLLETLLSLGANVSSYIPNRFTEGYGPNKEAFKNIIESGISLIITVDNGIAAVEEIEYANNHACDVIITDHHKIQDTLPNAYAIIHPEHPNYNYPFGKLAGVGVAFKLAHALLDIFPDFLLDLVAIGTIADLVPMLSENRIFVKQGLNLINEDTRLGIKFLLDIANHSGIIDEQTISFIIAPRLNAIGRISSAKEGLLLLSTDDIDTAYELAKKVDNYNSKRKKITESILGDVENKLKLKNNNNLLVLYAENYHEGVLGIVASNIVEKYKKPALIMNKEKNKLKGSARSMYDFNIYEAMNKINKMFIAFGGHSMAAGFSTTIDFIDNIEEKLNEFYNEYLHNLPNSKLDKNIDLIINYDDISYQLLSELERLKPFGIDFEKPIILIENIEVLEKIEFGSDKQYLKLIVGNNNYDKLECISFKDNKDFREINEGDIISVICNLDKNNFNGRSKLQINLIDIEKKEYLFKDYRNKNIDFNSFDKSELKLSQKYSDMENNYYRYSELKKIDKNYDVINIIDIPNKKEFITYLLKFKPKQINVICADKNTAFKKYKINKERLIKLFNLLLNYKQIVLNKNEQLNYITKILDTNIDSLKIMIEIFMELKLISINKNTIIINNNYSKINLNNSKTYVSMNERFYIEKLLLEGDIITINNKLLENSEN